MFENLMQGMNESEAKAILATTLPPELEKEAEAEVAQHLLADAIYRYGYSQGQRLYGEFEGEGDLSKVASAEEIAEFEAEETSAREEMDKLFVEARVAETENPAELEKSAQAAAGILFQGWSDAIEKIAADKEADEKEASAKGSHLAKAKKMLGHLGKKLKENPGRAALAAGGAAGAGYAAHKALSKKASECTVDEISDAVLSKLDGFAVVDEGCEKLAANAAMKAAKGLFGKAKGKVQAAAKAGKGYLKSHGKAMAGAGAAGAAAGVAAGRASKE